MIFEKIHFQFENNLPFVVYKKPFSDKIIGFFSKDDILETWNPDKKGFLFHPFQEGEKVFFDEKSCEILFEKTSKSKEIKNKIDEKTNLDEVEFKKLVSKTIAFIQENPLDKIVISTFENVDLQKNNLANIYKNLYSNYSSAFCYWFYHPKIGMWMGATPELLLQKKETKITTVSLAGTQIYSENIVWKEKEIDEQKYVTNYIKFILEKYCKNININTLETNKAGNLAHLKTEINANLNDEKLNEKLLLALHPTPAVCGLPKEKALEFIIENENYQRKYYTGFLGEWNKNFDNFEENQSHLFVNLRCMEIFDNYAKIYVGCGITKDSVPEKEFQEIVNKSKTMRNILIINEL
jgi:isochorismate synthase